MSEQPFWQSHQNFYPNANQLRGHFTKLFENPLDTKSERFCWDYWYVKDQYKLIRTPAEHFFTGDLYESFEKYLISWGKENLGCNNVSPMWLSYYVDGCEQKLHSDSPHGPWAFVFSLTDWDKRTFTGGETFLLKPETLSYWDFFDNKAGVEKPQLIETIPPRFNQLTVFDPRFPHGVQRVHGAHEPKDSRIVIHGWFTEPSPCFFGALTEAECHASLNTQLDNLNLKIQTQGVFNGLLSFKVNINPDGSVKNINNLCDTLIEINALIGNDELIDLITNELKGLSFPKKDKPSSLILPFVFS